MRAVNGWIVLPYFHRTPPSLNRMSVQFRAMKGSEGKFAGRREICIFRVATNRMPLRYYPVLKALDQKAEFCEFRGAFRRN